MSAPTTTNNGTFVQDFPTNVTWPPAESQFLLDDPLQLATVDRYLWIVILGGVVSFLMAWGIGANDVANAFATSVGAGSINLKWACVIAGVMEFIGALLLGSRVTSTVRKNILKVVLFDPNQGGILNGPEMLMYAFFCSLISATIWLVIATAFSLPVSTTHSIVGALVGVGLCFDGAQAVFWLTDGTGVERLGGVVGILIAWVLSPLVSGIIALALFLVVRTLVLRAKNPVRKGLVFRPLFYGFSVVVVVFFIVFKGSPNFDLSEQFSIGEILGMSLAGGAVAAVFTWFILNPRAMKNINMWEKQRLEQMHQTTDVEHKSKVVEILKKVGVHMEINEDLSDEVLAIHDNAEKFDDKTEKLFSFIQVFSASFDAFAHGANDVANAVAPFSSIYALYATRGILSIPTVSPVFDKDGTFDGGGSLDGEAYLEKDPVPNGETFCGMDGGTNFFRCRSVAQFGFLTPEAPGADSSVFSLYDKEGSYLSDSTCYTQCNPANSADYEDQAQDVKLWILVIGAVGIVVGLLMWGYRVIIAIGEKLTKLTPSRGFAIETGASLTVLIASGLGLPVSTTHCQVGATVGVGLAEFRGNAVNWAQFILIFIGWGITIIFTGLVSACFFSIAVYAPLRFPNPQFVNYCPGQQTFLLTEQSTVNGVVCSGMT